MIFNTKVYKDQGGDRQVTVAGGQHQLGDTTLTVDTDGDIIVTGLPTADPEKAGALWSNGGVLTVSAG